MRDFRGRKELSVSTNLRLFLADGWVNSVGQNLQMCHWQMLLAFVNLVDLLLALKAY